MLVIGILAIVPSLKELAGSTPGKGWEKQTPERDPHKVSKGPRGEEAWWVVRLQLHCWDQSCSQAVECSSINGPGSS